MGERGTVRAAQSREAPAGRPADGVDSTSYPAVSAKCKSLELITLSGVKKVMLASS
jgi:hypothetical protein